MHMHASHGLKMMMPNTNALQRVPVAPTVAQAAIGERQRCQWPRNRRRRLPAKEHARTVHDTRIAWPDDDDVNTNALQRVPGLDFSVSEKESRMDFGRCSFSSGP
jgi:hypothetical protein